MKIYAIALHKLAQIDLACIFIKLLVNTNILANLVTPDCRKKIHGSRLTDSTTDPVTFAYRCLVMIPLQLGRETLQWEEVIVVHRFNR